ncbi:C40 family peptidase [Streptomyces griseocarneus]|uniref:C40 family peptidase n=1 Tax=Streptomyces griseocarneus TaxID=51201 RepID=UPI001982F9A1|nr:C40 family peptidase [Streptomyces griseocarneus]MBZ6478000.1 C40 family peptidase [Streptomyces griseocarneus]GHG64353.1 glycoside hydrolase [Streptomyces griseocarneus]
MAGATGPLDVKRPFGATGPGARRLALAVALVCALGAGALAVPAVAHADPGPPQPAASSAAPAASSLEEVHKQVESLYRKAEAATDAYNAANEQQRLQEKAVAELTRRVKDTQQRLDLLRGRTGALARAQYRSGALTPPTQLFFSDSPETFLNGVSLARKGEQATRDLLTQLTATRADLGRYAKAAEDRRKTLEGDRKKKEAAKKEIESRLEAAKKLESKLADKERERLRQLEEERARQAQATWLSSSAGKGVMNDKGSAATGDGKRAVDFASAQIGKNYVWGAEGPDTYDCSGLTLKAWAAAGRAIPRTSQEQWRQLPKIDVKDMRPGDLVIYFSDASHVGVYAGDGMIVHAPRPGRQVTLAGAGSMPILGIVRPG